MAEAGEPGRLAVRAERQTNGRGTQGRGWESPAGNLSLSVLLRPGAGSAESGQWALLAAVALADTLAAVLPEAAPPRLKWPNDVLVSGAKLAGILVEGSASAGGILDWLVIGFGVNLATAPDIPGRAVAALASHAAAPTPSDFADALLARLDHWDDVRQAQGFAPVRAAWLTYGPALGSTLHLSRPDGVADGRFAGLAEDGGLLLEAAGTVRAWRSGEVLA